MNATLNYVQRGRGPKLSQVLYYFYILEVQLKELKVQLSQNLSHHLSSLHHEKL